MPGSGPPGYDAGGYPPPQGVYPPVQQQPGAQMMAPMHGGDDQVIIKNTVSAIIFYFTFQPPNFGAPVQGPEGENWMAPVGEQMVPLNCPPGLEYLTMIDQLIVKQKLEALEAIAGVMDMNFETANKYKIKNVLGQVGKTDINY